MIVKEIMIALGIDVDGAGFKKAESAVDRVRGVVKKLAAAYATYQVGAFVAGAIESGAALDDLAHKIGVDVAALQELQFAAGMSGASAEQMAQGLGFLTRTAAEAATGNKAAADTFAQFGIKLRGADGKVRSSEALFSDVADRVAQARTETEQYGIATAFLGARNGALVGVLKEGRAGIAALGAQARELGIILGEEDVRSMAEADDALFALRGSFGALGTMLAKEITPWLLRLLRYVRQAGGFAKLFRKILRQVTDALQIAAVVITSLGAAMLVFTFRTGLATLANASLNAGLIATAANSARAAVALVAAGAQAAIAWAAAALPVLAIAAAFVALGVILALVVEELVALGSDTEGLFEGMTGKWEELSASLWNNADWERHPLLAFLQSAAAAVTLLVGGLDRLTAFGWQTLAEIVNAPGDFLDDLKATRAMARSQGASSVIDNQGRLVSTLGNGAVLPTSVSARPGAGASSASATVNTSINIEVDASGQSMDAAQVNALVRKTAEDVVAQQNQHAFRALTPAGTR